MAHKKVANSCMRVLTILKDLYYEPLSIDEILARIEDNESTKNVYSKETISKYFNTLKKCGFELEKVKNKFYIINNFSKITLKTEEIRTFNFLKDYISHLHDSELKSNLEDIFKILENSLSPATRELMKKNVGKGIILKNFSLNSTSKIIKKFERYCKEKQRLKITYLNNDKSVIYTVDPKKLFFNKDKVFLLAFDYEGHEHKEFLLENITDTKQLPQMSKGAGLAQTVTFKLKNHLAKVYVMRPGESKIEETDNSITIVNAVEDREQLMHRLLRYRENCEVVSPSDFKEKFVNHIDEILAVYEQ